jgi:outer membrane usher protein FimD/PapC
MTVRLFGNGPSPAIATFGMRKTAEDGEEGYGSKVKEFICKDFYVNDGLTSLSTEEEVVDLVQKAQACLKTANLHLHKVASNSALVMVAFPLEDRAKEMKDLDLRQDVLPIQRSLGVQWNLENDQLTFNVSIPEKPLTRRGRR